MLSGLFLQACTLILYFTQCLQNGGIGFTSVPSTRKAVPPQGTIQIVSTGHAFGLSTQSNWYQWSTTCYCLLRMLTCHTLSFLNKVSKGTCREECSGAGSFPHSMHALPDAALDYGHVNFPRTPLQNRPHAILDLLTQRD